MDENTNIKNLHITIEDFRNEIENMKPLLSGHFAAICREVGVTQTTYQNWMNTTKNVNDNMILFLSACKVKYSFLKQLIN